jgi:hypothetical protein
VYSSAMMLIEWSLAMVVSSRLCIFANNVQLA